MGKTAHQVWKEAKDLGLEGDKFKQHFIDNGIIIPNTHSVGVRLINEERKKQIIKFGFTAENQANNPQWYSNYQLQEAAHSLLAEELYEQAEVYDQIPNNWEKEWWDKLCNHSRKERLIIAGALIAAELDRLDAIDNMK